MAKDLSIVKIYIIATFNNTLVTVTDKEGNTLVWGSSGSSGFKGARKSTPFAATTAVEQVLRRAQALGVKQAEVYIKGPGPGRDAALRAIRSVGVKINLIADVTPIPHNGPRPKKPRRI
jgi:small subunit ribosomal protein S11